MLNLAIHTLETERLVLRAPCEADAEQEFAFWASDASKFVGGPLRPDEAWRAIGGILGHWVMRGYGFWAVDDKETGAYLGRVGLWNPLGWPEREIGWTLMPQATGKGYATEAGEAARAHAYDVLGWDTAISLIAPDNTASKAVATRLGAAFDYHYEHPKFGQTEVWRHPAPEALVNGGMEAYA